MTDCAKVDECGREAYMRDRESGEQLCLPHLKGWSPSRTKRSAAGDGELTGQALADAVARANEEGAGIPTRASADERRQAVAAWAERDDEGA